MIFIKNILNLPTSIPCQKLDIFLELLQTCRRRYVREDFISINKVIPTIDTDVNKLIMEVKILRDKFGIKHFTEAMLALIRDVYNVYY